MIFELLLYVLRCTRDCCRLFKGLHINFLSEEIIMKELNRAKEYLPGSERQRSRGYSPAVVTTGGRSVYLAGHGGYSDESGKTYPGDFDAQVRICFERIGAVLAKAGGSLDDIVSMTVFIVDMKMATVLPSCVEASSPTAIILEAR